MSLSSTVPVTLMPRLVSQRRPLGATSRPLRSGELDQRHDQEHRGEYGEADRAVALAEKTVHEPTC